MLWRGYFKKKKAIRKTEIMLGDGIKSPTYSEIKNIEGIRRSVVAKSNLNAGTILQLSDLICKRPGNGISPTEITKLVGQVLKKNKVEDEPIHWDDLN